MFSCHHFVIMVLVIPCVDCYPDGKGVDDSCSSLTPSHGANSQTSTAPYSITFSPTTFTPGQTVAVTLSASGTYFMGFMIQARRADTSLSQELLGSFTGNSQTRPACNGQALVQSSGSTKTSLTFNWISPSSSVGNITFRVTYVRAKRTFWANCASSILKEIPAATGSTTTKSAAPSNSSTTTTIKSAAASTTTTTVAKTLSTAMAQAAAIVQDSGCGTTKGCFSSCSTSGCRFIVSWQTSGTSVTYTLRAVQESTSGVYLALGFSGDSEMGGDSVMGCAYENNVFGKYVGFNVGKSSQPYTDNQIQLTASTFANGVLTCQLTRPINGSGSRYDLSQPWTLLFVGGVGSVSNGQAFITNHFGNYFISDSSTSAASYKTITSQNSDNNGLVKTHGCLMVVAWILLASIGTVVARFYKPVLNGTLISQKVWFQLHRSSMVLVLCVTAAAFIIIFVKEKEWSKLEGEESYLRGHPIMGVIVMILTISNPVMALFRPHPGTPKRPIFNWAHLFVGLSAHILGVITIFFGVKLQSADTPDYAVKILGAYVAWQIFVYILLELITRCNWFKESKKEVYELSNNNSTKTDPSPNLAKENIVKKIIFVTHCVVVACLSVAVIVVIAVGRSGADSD
ncbi:DOMON domain-containing protein frrs1L [Bulinus truncatus]|nr:DOMON domain-containing protein frrs1L [Bulinus truncatus]